MNKPTTCNKIGIKIHESNNNINSSIHSNINYNNISLDPNEFYNKLKSENRDTGIRIVNNNNTYIKDPFESVKIFKEEENVLSATKYDKASYESLDLNIESYSRGELFKLFGIQTNGLSEDIMREAKKIVLKTHPDKSRLEPKYFLFFSKAYKRLYNIYEFQNKTTKKDNGLENYKDTVDGDFFTKENVVLLDTLHKKKGFVEPTKFNNWFNEQFEKNKLEDAACDSGYGDWLKSNEDIIDVGNVSQANIGIEIEKRKKAVQSLTTYTGVNELQSYSSTASSLMDYNTNNFTSGSLFSNEGMGYTDLRQAYVESVIPVTQEDYNKVAKFKNVDEYKRHRDSANSTPLSKEESMRKLFQQNKTKDEESSALAFYYAQQMEKTKKNNDSFWSSIKQLTNK